MVYWAGYLCHKNSPMSYVTVCLLVQFFRWENCSLERLTVLPKTLTTLQTVFETAFPLIHLTVTDDRFYLGYLATDRQVHT